MRLREALSAERAELAVAVSQGRSHPVIGPWKVALRDALREALIVEGFRKVENWTSRYRVAAVSWAADRSIRSSTRTPLRTSRRLRGSRRLTVRPKTPSILGRYLRSKVSRRSINSANSFSCSAIRAAFKSSSPAPQSAAACSDSSLRFSPDPGDAFLQFHPAKPTFHRHRQIPLSPSLSLAPMCLRRHNLAQWTECVISTRPQRVGDGRRAPIIIAHGGATQNRITSGRSPKQVPKPPRSGRRMHAIPRRI